MHANQHWLDKGNVRIKENEKIINPTTHIQYRKTTLLKRKEQRNTKMKIQPNPSPEYEFFLFEQYFAFYFTDAWNAFICLNHFTTYAINAFFIFFPNF